MLRHLVLFTLMPGVNANDPRVRSAVAAEDELAAVVPSWRFGANTTGRRDAADFAGSGDFASIDALHEFLEHAAHREAGRLWAGISHWLVADIELAEGD